ncbi:hypothetical protein [Pseudomonas sp. S2_F03]
MSQHDMNIANAAGLPFRTDLNAALVALASQSSGASAPSPSFPCQFWGDIGTGRLRQRDSTNTAWIDRGPLDSVTQATVNVGETRNGKMAVAAASATATYTADEIIVKSALGGLAFQLSNFSQGTNLAAANGAGAMDTGAAPASGWVAIYAIYNPVTNAKALLGVASPNTVMPAVYGGAFMPSGYTASALLTVVPTNASSQFKVCSVFGRDVYIQLTAAFVGSPVNANTALTGIVPANAVKIISGEMIVQSTLASTMSLTVVSQLGTLLGQQNLSTAIGAGAATSINFGGVPLTVPQNVGIIGSSTAGVPTYSVYVSGYSI